MHNDHTEIFCDVAKAVDCVNHKILLVKLHFCGVQVIFADWLRFYLNNRRQEIEINSPFDTQFFFSDWGALKCGVLQGLILGLLNLKNHIEQMIHNLNGACNAFRSMFLISNNTILRSALFTYFHSVP
jgi:hypothetical protein